ncbi:MAG TPA: AI-2E family transporter, partial [Stenomitos sp.]
MPPLSLRTKRLVAGSLTVGGLAFLYVVHQVLAPFLVALLLVYILNPLVDWLSVKRIARWTIGRKGAVALVFLGFFTVLGLGGLLLGPQIYGEGARLTREMPAVIRDFEHKVLAPFIASVQGGLDRAGIRLNARENLDNVYASILHSSAGHTTTLLKQGQMVVKGIFS